MTAQRSISRGERSLHVARLVALVLALAAIPPQAPSFVVARPGDDLQTLVHTLPAGSMIELAPGTFDGPLKLRRAIAMRGPAIARVTAATTEVGALFVRADNVRIAGITIEGGDSGIVVRDADDVELQAVTVQGARLHGIEVVDGSVTIDGVRVRSLKAPLAQGIEIRNASDRPVSVVENTRVVGRYEGIVSHVARVRFVGNQVTGTTGTAIGITEMSTGLAARNFIAGVRGRGLLCSDESRCELRDNRVGPVAAGDGGRSSAGWGLVVHYRSSAMSRGNHLEGEAGRIAVLSDSRLVDRTPLELADARDAIVPALLAVLAALVVLVLAMRVASTLARPARLRLPVGVGALAVLLATGLVVQSFHMFEHFLQVFRVHFDGVPSRGGLAGPSVETEWVHLAYNVAVVGLVAAVALTPQWRTGAKLNRAGTLVWAALLVQGYHVVEHLVKVLQHVQSGAKVNPGIAGQAIDLVWMHFALNLAVYVGFVGATVGFAVAAWRGRREVPQPALA